MSINIPFQSRSKFSMVLPSNPLFLSKLFVKLTSTTSTNASLAAFWTAITPVDNRYGWNSAQIVSAANTTEQTVIDITGSGILTHVITPRLNLAGDIIIRITVDGVLTVITRSITISSIVNILGYTPPWKAEISTSGTVGLGGNADEGFALNPSFILPTPTQSLLESPNLGVVYKNSLKVTIQGSVAITAIADQNNAGVLYLDHIPPGYS